jgi:hypothetical protein
MCDIILKISRWQSLLKEADPAKNLPQIQAAPHPTAKQDRPRVRQEKNLSWKRYVWNIS